ncbi:hypothetical protein [Leptolyngbya sp. 7M]|uniref:hypothetical protein n=1 Tax=Leptolyngbya sp. 7M TaxID=2812896 RepID=UPI001B8C1604|nr:hypothetical protein [Leptolyngbya sp. 7M]QYO66962.1 hypothetical protein JVX88_09220 [Leptolyngbya sp. 7M]
MRSIFFLGLIIVCVAGTSLGQQASSRVIVWGGEERCGYRSPAISEEESVRCQTEDTPRGKISILHHRGLSLLMAMLEDDKYVIIAAQISNETTEPIGFDPDKWGAAYYKDSPSFHEGARPLSAELSIPSRDLVRGIASGALIDSSGDNYLAGVSRTNTIRDLRNSEGTRTREIVQTNDREAEQLARMRTEARKGLTEREQERIRKTALTQKWVGAGESAKGLVYFNRFRKAGLVVINVPIDDTTYVFRFFTRRPRPRA